MIISPGELWRRSWINLKLKQAKKGNDWIMPVLKSIKKASPIGLKITLRSIREGRIQTLSECLRREFQITINTLRTIISHDFYEGIRAAIIDKDKYAPLFLQVLVVLLTNQEFRITIKSIQFIRLKWNPSTLDKVHDEQLDLIFKTFEEHDLELQIPIKEEEYCRWEGKYESSSYCLRTK